MQHLGVNFGAFGGLNLVSLSVFCYFLLKKSGLIFKSPMATLMPPTPQLAYTIVVDTHIVQCHYLSVLIRDHVMHPNTSVSSVNEHC